MNWGGLSGVFFIATVKFMFSTFGGPAFGLAFYETFLAAFAGSSISAAFFYFASDSWRSTKKCTNFLAALLLLFVYSAKAVRTHI